ncbi:dNTP-hexose glycosyl transferase [Microtetraspora sp. NBRC 13810]|uniref:nucleotide disphospho-sugar-binding domain-containing protein n=1 Tax=Microtetraspora sp. NBRC 13810 TaxID=3030990 RepID=UPI0024A56634|nr:nucleotide disphospho-sugar-binding domain-containing protein [Microtetraspora sp. NBRC 13810]GLW09407.1 dNTP-hexose glycosyl transferase [Microtetraspora sp. NBRC 13810]
MKALFIPGNSPATIYTHAALATAVRNAGHSVFVAGINWLLPDIASVGLSAVQISPLSEADVFAFMAQMPEDPEELARASGRVYAEIAVEGLQPLLEMSEYWRPDVVVGGPMFYGAPLLAHHLSIPSVLLEWDRGDASIYDPGAMEVLRPVLDELGIDRLPGPDLRIDICPPSLRPSDAPPAQLMRFVPVNPQRALEPWMYAKGDRPRVCITGGSRVFRGDALRRLAAGIGKLGVEVIIAAPEPVAAQLREELPDVRAGWIPLDVLAPTCDAIVHHGGGATDMTSLASGVPQLIAIQDVSVVEMRRLADAGAAIMLGPDEQQSENIVAACEELLANPDYRDRARGLAQEIATLPPPAEVVGLLENLATG